MPAVPRLSSEPPIAVRDEHLAAFDGATVKVLLWCYRQLSFGEFRPAKAAGIAHSLRIRRETVARALRRLVDDGYLQSGPREGAVGTYCLVRIRTER